MALAMSNYFNVLADKELDGGSKVINDLPKKATTPLPDARKRKKKAAGQAKAQKVVDVNWFLKPPRRERPFPANTNGCGKFNGRFSGAEDAAMAEHVGTTKADPDPSILNIEDRSQFPALK